MDIIVEKCKILNFNGAMHLKCKLRICTVQIKLEKIGFLNLEKSDFCLMLKDPKIIFSYKEAGHSS